MYTELESIQNHTGDIIGIPTGFIDLDKLTNGLHPGQMIVVAARPAMGKSTSAWTSHAPAASNTD